MKRDGFDLADILYLAYALPALRERSEEAAASLEAAILEFVVAMSKGERNAGGRLDLTTYLAYALDDVAAVTPVGAGLLRRAISSLNDTRREVFERPSLPN
jgi:hypothetical protein